MSKKAIEITSATFQTEVLDSDGVVLVDFWAPWCGPCRFLEPIIETLAKEYNGRARIAKLNVDENPNISTLMNIRSLPTLILFKNGQVVDTRVGAVSQVALQQMLDTHLSE